RLVLADAEVGEDGVLDVPGLVDEEGGATHAESERSLYVVHLDHEAISVRQEGERELVLLAESAVTLGTLRTHTRDFEPRRVELRVQVPDLASLARASRREVGRVEVEDERAVAQQIAERSRLAVLVRQGEFRRPGADCQHWALQSGSKSAAS